MIAKDQPTIFPPHVTVRVSSLHDGNMKKGALPPHEAKHIDQNRETFLGECGIRMDETVLVSLSYKKDDFCVYQEVTTENRGEGIISPHTLIADALVTRQKNVALFLPIADCCPVVLYDQDKDILMLSHLGRHSVEQQGAQRSVEYLMQHYGSSPDNIAVWLGPAAGKQTYPLFAFDHKSLHEVIFEQLLAAGIHKGYIEQATVDVTQTMEYFSHSEFLKGHRESDGRFAVVAMLK